MASAQHRSHTELSEYLQKNAKAFDFYQAAHLLDRLASKNGCKLKLTPKLTLARAASDIDAINIDSEHYQVVINFLNLCNANSPLPTYYLEELIDLASNNNYEAKAFLDIFHQRLYELLIEIWRVYNLGYQLYFRKNSDLQKILLNMSGLSLNSKSELLEKYPDLNCFLMLFADSSKGLLNLQHIVSESFATKVAIHSFYPGVTAISLKQQNRLGKKNHQLNYTCYLGQQAISSSSSILLHFIELNVTQFQSLMPGRILYDKLSMILKYYLNKPLNCYLKLTVNVAGVDSDCLGMSNNALGESTWLGQPQAHYRHNVLMNIQY
jgi:type VI secretion system protein ImpH